jgi:cytochrome c-type biogenesis protein
MTMGLLTFTEGILAFISPCLLPMLPIYFTYLAGGDADNAPRVIRTNALGFVLGFTIVFTLMGATATFLGSFLVQYRPWIQKIAGFFVIVLGIEFIGVFKNSFLKGFSLDSIPFKQKGFFSSILFGFIFAVGWTPCLGTFLGAALLKASSREFYTEGMALLFFFSLGLGIPFILSALWMEKLKNSFSFIKKNNKKIRLVSGIFLILVGLSMVFNFFNAYTRFFRIS